MKSLKHQLQFGDLPKDRGKRAIFDSRRVSVLSTQGVRDPTDKRACVTIRRLFAAKNRCSLALDARLQIPRGRAVSEIWLAAMRAVFGADAVYFPSSAKGVHRH